MNKNSVVIHIPHSSSHIPDKFKSQYLLTEAELESELLKMTDWYTDELFDIPGFKIHCNRISRLVMDPERFRSDDLEEMARFGMGVAYTQTSDRRTLRNISDSENEQILTELYDPYHYRFTQTVEEILLSCGHCMIIDAHSFPSQPLPYEIALNKTKQNRPDLCLGYDPYHIDGSFLRLTESFFTQKQQLAVAHNFPFAGSIVPAKYYHKDKRVQSLMIELNRALYLDERTGRKTESFHSVQDMIRDYFMEVTKSGLI